MLTPWHFSSGLLCKPHPAVFRQRLSCLQQHTVHWSSEGDNVRFQQHLCQVVLPQYPSYLLPLLPFCTIHLSAGFHSLGYSGMRGTTPRRALYVTGRDTSRVAGFVVHLLVFILQTQPSTVSVNMGGTKFVYMK